MSHSGFDRPNFYFAVHEQKSVYKDLKTYMVKKDDRWQFEGPTIIYTISRKKAEQVSAILQSKYTFLCLIIYYSFFHYLEE